MSGAVATVAYNGPDAIARALDSEAEWLWLLAEDARPDDGALDRLLEASTAAGAAPAVLAGLLLDEAGRPLRDDLQPAPRIDSAEAVRLVRQRLLPLASAGFAHCLVARAAFRRHGVPDARRFGVHAPEEWTARVLREEAGYLVPASVVALPGRDESVGGARAVPNLLATMRMLPTGTWTRGYAARRLWRALRTVGRDGA